MKSRIEITKPYPSLLLGLIIYELFNFMLHANGWSIFSLDELAAFKTVISFAVVDHILSTEEYNSYATSFAEFMVFSVATIPVLTIFWLIGVFKSFQYRKYGALTTLFVSTHFYIFLIGVTVTRAHEMFLGNGWPENGVPYFAAPIGVTLTQLITTLMIIISTAKYNSRFL